MDISIEERNDIFSVRSAYRIVREFLGNGYEDCSNASKQQALWKALWKIKVPNKIQVFAWRACRERLPN